MLGAIAAIPSAAATATPNVVVTIKPIHSLVSGVMHGIGEPHLILRGPASPHHYQLRPSDAAKLSQANILFRVGGTLETFLEKPLVILRRNTRLVDLIKTPGIMKLNNRTRNNWSHDDDSHTDHVNGSYDTHIWLNPDNAKKMIGNIVTELGAVDPDNKAGYVANGETVISQLDAMDLALEQHLRPVRHLPYMVFHDAYQYLEDYYGLNSIGAVAISPDRKPGARRIKSLREKIQGFNIQCIFSETQFEPAVIRTIIEGSNARVGVLDPIGSALDPGPQAYFEMMEQNARAIRDCLGD